VRTIEEASEFIVSLNSDPLDTNTITAANLGWKYFMSRSLYNAFVVDADTPKSIRDNWDTYVLGHGDYTRRPNTTKIMALIRAYEVTTGTDFMESIQKPDFDMPTLKADHTYRAAYISLMDEYEKESKAA
jgi:hypothetical protein